MLYTKHVALVKFPNLHVLLHTHLSVALVQLAAEADVWLYNNPITVPYTFLTKMLETVNVIDN